MLEIEDGGPGHAINQPTQVQTIGAVAAFNK